MSLINESLLTRLSNGIIEYLCVSRFTVAYGTAQFKLDNEMHVKLESLNKFVGPLVSRVSLREWEGALAPLTNFWPP